MRPTSFAVAVLLLASVAAPGPAAGARAVQTGAAGDSLPGRIEGAPRCPETLEVLLPAAFARERGLSPGDRIRILPGPEARGCVATVSGLFRPRPDPSRLTVERPRVLFHLPQLARLTGREGEVDRFSVELVPGTDPGRVRRDLSGLLPGARILPAREVAEETSTTFRVVRRFHRAIGFITLTAGSVFLCCIMVLKVQERRTEVAALRLVGVSRRTLLGWIVAESALVSVLGAAGGIGLGHVASDLINRFYGAAYDTRLVFSVVTPDTVGLVTVLAVVLGLGAGLAAGFHLLSLDPLEEVGR